MLKDQDDLTNYMYDRQVLAKVVEDEEEEKHQRQKKLEENARLAAIQKNQLEEYKQRYINELREVRRYRKLLDFSLFLHGPMLSLFFFT